jgi:Ca2+-binding RTX toxin-like protein
MTPNSRIVKYLISLYRGVVRRQWSENYRHSGEYLSRLAGLSRLEPLEPRVLLTTQPLTDVPLATYAASPSLYAGMQADLRDGIYSLADRLGELSAAGDFSTDIPGVLHYTFGQAPTAQNLLTLLNSVNGGSLAGLLKTEIADRYGALLDGTSFSSLNFSVSNSTDTSTTIHYAISGTGASLISDGGDNYHLDVHLSLTVTQDESSALYFDLGRNADQLGIRSTFNNVFANPPFNAEVNVKAGLTVAFDAQLKIVVADAGTGAGDTTVQDITVSVINNQTDFSAVGVTLAANANINTLTQDGGPIHPVASNMQLGFLDVDLTLDHYKLDGHITQTLTNNASSSALSYGDLVSNSILHTSAISGTMDAKVTIAVDNIGHFADNFNAGPHNYFVSFQGPPDVPANQSVLGAEVSSIPGSSDHRTAPKLQFSDDAAARLAPYVNVNAGAVVGMLKAFANRMGNIPGSSILNTTIPLTTNTTLGDLIPLGDLLSDQLIFNSTQSPSAAARLVDSNGNPRFTSAQTFIQKLADILGYGSDAAITSNIKPTLTYSNSANQIEFTIEFGPTLNATSSDVSLNLNLGDIGGFKTVGSVTLTPTAHFGFTFGIDVASGGTTPVVITPPVQNTFLKAVVGSNGLTLTPANGQLSGDAIFKLTVGGGPNGTSSFSGGVATIVLNASVTAGNSSLTQLVSELQTAINVGLDALDPGHILPNPVSQPRTGHLYVTVGTTNDGRLTLSSEFTSFLKVATASGDVSFSQLGFLNGQVASIAPSPANGILSGDASFTLLVGTQSSPIAISMPQGSTSGNTNISQLVTELDTVVSGNTGGLVHAVLLPGTANAIILKADSSVRFLQILNPSAAVLRDLGWQDRTIAAEIQAVDRNELDALSPATAPSNGKPGADVSFLVTVDGETPILVTVLQNSISGNNSSTSDNTGVADLAADINQALGTLTLDDGRRLGSVFSATALDSDHDGQALPDTIQFRSTADVHTFSVAPSTNSSMMGLSSTINSSRIGPDPTTGAVPASGAQFSVSVGTHAPVVLTIPTGNHSSSADPMASLVQDLQTAINGSALAGLVVAGRLGDHLVLADPNVADQQIRITLDNSTASAAGQAAETVLGFQDNQVARSAGAVTYYVDHAGADLGLTVGVTNLTASATLGFIGLTAGDIDANLSFTLGLDLKDQSNGSTRINIDKLVTGNLTDTSFTGNVGLPSNGHLGGDTSFKIKVNGTEVTVNVTDNAATRDALVANVQKAANDALDAAGVNAHITASLGAGSKLQLSVSTLAAHSFEITAGSAALGLAVSAAQYGLVDASANWSGSLDVQNISVTTPITGMVAIPSFDVHEHIGNGLPGLISFTPDAGDLAAIPQALKNFADLIFNNPTVGGILQGVQDLEKFFSGNFNALPILGTKIPFLNESFADLLGLGTTFQKVVDALSANPTDVVQNLRNRIIEALNLPSNVGNDVVDVAYDGATNALLLKLTFEKSFNKTLPLDFNLNLPFDIKGNAALEVEGAASAKLAIGIDLSDPVHPSFFLDTAPADTGVNVRFAARGAGMSFTASFGPVGLFIQDGQAAIDLDGNPLTNGTAQDVNFAVTLSDNDGTADNRVKFTDIFSNINNLGITAGPIAGKLSATLPIYFPTDSDFLGNLSLKIDDLNHFLTTGDLSDVQTEVPDLSNLLTNLNFNLLDNLPVLIQGVDFVFGQLQTFLDKDLGTMNIPLIGNGLKDASQFINNLRSTVFQGLLDKFAQAQNKTEQVITDALTTLLGSGPGGLNILQSPITVDKNLTSNDTTEFVQWTLNLGDSYSQSLPFDLGVPALGLHSADGVTVGINWNLNVGFGLDYTHGFYFLLGDAAHPEVSVKAFVDLPSDITGNLLFFKVNVKDNTPNTPGVTDDATANLSLDLSDGGDPSNRKITLDQLGNLDVAFNASASANIDVHITAGIDPGSNVSGKAVAALPKIVTDFKLDWTFDALHPSDGGLTFVGFKDIGLDLGSFFTDFLKPVIGGIQDVTKPLQPFIDVFTSPIPVISDLAGQPVTLLDVASLFGEVDPDMLDAVANLITMVNSIPVDAGNIVIPFGDVTLLDTSVNPTPGFNLFDPNGLDAVRNATNLTDPGAVGDVFGNAISNFGSFSDRLDAFNATSPTPAPADVTSFSKGLDGQSFGDFIAFPFLKDPSQILGALFGRPFTIVTLDLPEFSFGFSYSQFFPIIGPLGASVTGTLSAKFKFAFGYDSQGLQDFAAGGFEHPFDLFRGFYVSDTQNADGTGPDINEVEISGSLVGSAELNLGVAKGSVGGGVKVTFGLNLNDPNHDGKVRLEELLNNIRYADPPFNPLGIFDLNIKVDAFLTWAIEVLFVFKASGQIGPSLPLLDLTIPLPHDPVLATDVGDGVLRLNSGNFAKDRLNQNIEDGNEDFTVTQTADNGDGTVNVKVSGFGADQEYDNVKKIEAYGGQGNDTFKFVGLSVPVFVDAGQGDDVIDFSQSSGPLTAVGGTGNDKIFGGTGNDVIHGNDGGDLIVGGGGNDWLYGDDGNDIVSGDGNDIIYGGAGNDKLAGGPDADYISGGTGDDEIWGDATFGTDGTFIAAAGVTDGADWLSGDDGKDTIHGDGGNDRIGGGAAADFIEGNLGADTIYGDSTYVYNATSGAFDVSKISLAAPLPQTEGNDVIYGDSQSAPLTGPSTDGGDTIYGEAGNDFIRGNGGNDTVYGGEGSDIIFGDQNNDHLEGGAGPDVVFGGADNDTVLGQDGSDILFGDDGLVVYYNFPSFTGIAGYQVVAGSLLIGDDNPALVSHGQGDTGTDDPLSRDFIITDVLSTDGNDYVDGSAGNDVAFGGGGNDTVIGDDDPTAGGFDATKAPTGNDLLFGDGGLVQYDHHVTTKAATFSTNPADGGDDNMYGDNGADVMFGGPGNDTMNGGNGISVITVGADQDVLLGDHGEVDYTLGKITKIFTTNEGVGGTDTINGNEDNDVLMGGAAGDLLNGNAGNDIMIGDQGQVDYVMPDTVSKATLLSVIKTTDTSEVSGGIDTINGSTGDDIALGGVQGDNISGNEGADILLGDEGQLDYGLSGTIGGATFDGNNLTLDRIQTTSFSLGGDDHISGAEANDVAIGGSGGDTILGDNQLNGTPVASPGNDILIGDQGEVDYFNVNATGSAINVTRIITTDTAPTDGGVDTISGNQGADVILGGVAGDFLNGNDGNDTILGDEGQLQYNLSGGLNQDANPLTVDNIETLQPSLGGSDTIQGNAGADFAFGGAAGDFIYGDAALVGDLNAATDGNDTLFGDGGRVSLTGGVTWKIESTATAIGGSDYMEGNAGADLMLGGAFSDEMHGDAGTSAKTNAALDGNDIMLGDNGLLNWLFTGDAAYAAFESTLPSPAVDANINTLDVITTIAPNDGGNDMMFGNAGSDIMFGGTGSDLLVGDNTKGAPGSEAFGPISPAPGSDLEFGDHGRIYPQSSFLPNFPSRNFLSIDTTFTSGGAGDFMFGNEQDDVMLGGQGNDQMFGNSGDDDMIGGHNVSGGIDSLVTPTPGSTTNDYMDGGSGNDAMAGDNAIIWRNGAAFQANDLRSRIRALAGTQIYGNSLNGTASGTVNVTAAAQNDPAVATTRTVILLDHDNANQTAGLASATGATWGNDLMAGGANNDAMFGQLGADTMQGDGSIDPTTLTFNLAESVSDGDDYMEGNGGADTMYGGLGQDDMIGGSSQLFGLATPDQRPDVGDTIYGGAGTEIARNDPGNTTAQGHARDADFILGDNGNIFRIVGTNGTSSGSYLKFNYDNYTATTSALTIVVRAAQLLDYTPGGIDYSAAAANDIGGNDLIHGEGGDDFIWGMKGSDIIYGEGQNDQIIAGYGNDWISGGTGDDAILGDDGLIFTSRNGLAEPLNGVTAIPANQLNQTITTPGKIQSAVINVSGQLKYAIDLTPFSSDPNFTGLRDEFTGGDNQVAGTTRLHNDDIIFGGLGSDSIHGGSGDDAISGGEALAESYGQLYDNSGNLVGIVRIDYTHPFNPGNELRFNPIDPNDPHHDKNHRAGEFALYDENDPMRQVLLNGDGSLNKDGTGKQFFLNFNATEGSLDTRWDAPGSQKNTDGDDVIFGDNGNDWAVGGTGRDDIYGGWGNDLLNADDNQTTNGGLNNQPDTAASYEDRAFGGAGKDVLIANTGGDRLIDWVGEFNSYLVPFSPFGMATVSRTVQPQLPEYLYALSASDGADFTRAFDAGTDPTRNGEPAGEIALVIQQDHDQWKDQTGAPTDPQAGNTTGTQRDVLRTDSLSSGAAVAFFADSGSWTSAANSYQGTASISASTSGSTTTTSGDAVSLFNIDTWLHTYYEVLASMKLSTTAGTGKQVGFIIFDYHSPTDFKYAGLDSINDVLRIGQRTAAGWIDKAVVRSTLNANSVYSPILAVNGATATFTLGKVSVSYTFSDPLNDGMTGLGTYGGNCNFLSITVQQLPHNFLYNVSEDFSDGVANGFTPNAGAWNTTSGTSGRYYATPDASGVAWSTKPFVVAPLSYVEYSATLRANANGTLAALTFAGDANNYLYAGLIPGANQVVIGHVVGGVFTNDYVGTASISANTDYSMLVELDRNSVNVILGGKVVAAFTYASTLVNQGRLGLLAKGGAASFDNLLIRGDDSLFNTTPQLLTAASTPSAGTSTVPTIATWQVAPIIDAAYADWARALGTSSATLKALLNLNFVVTNLGGNTLAQLSGNTIVLDDDAAGNGWYVDANPNNNSEYRHRKDILTATSGPASLGVDLLTAVMHEMGHALGLDHSSLTNNLMDSTLAVGTRRLPTNLRNLRSLLVLLQSSR